MVEHSTALKPSEISMMLKKAIRVDGLKVRGTYRRMEIVGCMTMLRSLAMRKSVKML